MTRPISLFDCERWDIGERIMLPKKYMKLLYFDPLFIYSPGRGVSVFYNYSDPGQIVDPLIDFLSDDIEWYKKMETKSHNDCDQLKKMVDQESKDADGLLKLILEVSATQAVANLLGSTDAYNVPKEVQEISIRVRDYSNKIFHQAIAYVSKVIAEELGNKDLDFVSMSEVTENKLPSKSEISKRQKGWLYYRGDISLDPKKYIADNKIKLMQEIFDANEEIRGQTACKGQAEGKAVVIFELDDLKRVQKGNIIVAPMTTPDMMTAIGKAAAIITDEGGITCHAAIVSRELKIPCIIGTGNATKMIKDGDLLKVDANNGVVEKL